MPIFLRSRLYINFAGRYDDALNELLTKGFGLKPAVAPILPAPARPSALPASASPTLPTMPRTWLIAGGGIIGVLVLCVLIAWVVGQLITTVTPTPTRVALVTETRVPLTSVATSTMQLTASPVPPTRAPTNTTVPPTAAPKPTEVPKPTEAPKPPAAPGIGSTKISADSATMVYVPAGEFTMGSNDYDDEKPPHAVYLDAFWIDKFEVTNALYKKCVDAGKCSAPQESKSSTRALYYGNSQYDNYPAINVTWENATQYCAFAKKQLPTEAQWEKAARGTDKRIYPWGDTFDVNKLNSSEGGKGDTTAVGSYPSGASPYGALDMAGNVWEWVADWYDANYYKNSPARNPTGPTSGQSRVVRGGSWGSSATSVRAADRPSTSTGATSSVFGASSSFSCSGFWILVF
jgi:formylglycine-generating enzyme required for sulfatase activity